MITNQNEITKYTNKNKIYIPNDKINNNWHYYMNGDYIVIVTNNNCYQNYNTTYCNCYNYNYKNNIMSEVRDCNQNYNNYEISSSLISNDINDSQYIRNYYIQDKIPIIGMFVIGIIFAILVTKESRY